MDRPTAEIPTYVDGPLQWRRASVARTTLDRIGCVQEIIYHDGLGHLTGREKHGEEEIRRTRSKYGTRNP